jgi:DNA-directed RNA polymerase subunit RPC12/RpoP
MVSSHQPTVKVVCATCGAQFAVSESMAGRCGACTKCGAQITVPSNPKPSLFDELDEPTSSTPHFRAPQYVGVDCRLCQTRLYGTPDQVGKELKCPDCGTLTTLRPPGPVERKRPEAMEGEQYELMDETTPSTSAQVASLPQYVALNCIRCDTLIHATLDQVGRMIDCPDCGKKNRVPPPPQRRAAESVLTSDGYDIDPAADPGERPPVVPLDTQLMHEQQFDATLSADRAAAARGKRRRFDDRGRPVAPRWPLVTGFIPFVLSPEVLFRWLGISFGLALAGLVLFFAYLAAMSGSYGATAAACFIALGAGLTIVSLAALASNFMAIVVESSDGAERIQTWSTQITDWFPDLRFPAAAILFSLLPGWLVSQFAASDQTQVWICISASMFIAFPIMSLAQLHNDSPLDVLSPKLLSTILRCPISWAVFYIESALLGVLFMAAANFFAKRSPLEMLGLFPVIVAVAFLYARLLGRLGWRLADATAATE